MNQVMGKRTVIVPSGKVYEFTPEELESAVITRRWGDAEVELWCPTAEIGALTQEFLRIESEQPGSLLARLAGAHAGAVIEAYTAKQKG